MLDAGRPQDRKDRKDLSRFIEFREDTEIRDHAKLATRNVINCNKSKGSGKQRKAK